jgi:hypothetical protein
MGASVPVFALIARAYGTSISWLYGMNTIGASLGVLLIGFVLLRALGVVYTTCFVASLNIFVFICTRLLERGSFTLEARGATHGRQLTRPLLTGCVIVFFTGFVTFGLEVAWFRAFRSAFHANTDSFAIMLAGVLLPLGIAPRFVPYLRRRGISPGLLLVLAAGAIFVSTPLVERIGLYSQPAPPYAYLVAKRLALSLGILGPSMLILGAVLPWLLEEHKEPYPAGLLYGVNTLGAVVGSLSTAWLLLPNLGFVRVAWLLGGVIAILALWRAPSRLAAAAGAVAALGIAIGMRVPTPEDLIDIDEGPNSTITVLQYPGDIRMLVIDGIPAMAEHVPNLDYPEWMGRLPMMLHPDPQRTLVICFGSGQTAHAVRDEGASSLDIVDINSSVFAMAHYFRSNHGVLNDPIVNAVSMDGRAWLRRTDRRYDIVTLEPMPPILAGVNALYSKEFYELVADRLEPGGVVAQWLPIHVLPPVYAKAATRTFAEAFPDSILWMTSTGPGILLGRVEETTGPLGTVWPRLSDPRGQRSLDEAGVLDGVLLDQALLLRYIEAAPVVTDDNQLLNYSSINRQIIERGALKTLNRNLDELRELSGKKLAPQ